MKQSGSDWFFIILGGIFLLLGGWVLLIPIGIIMGLFYLIGLLGSTVIEPAIKAGEKTGEWVKK